jgi:hypothetical protein
VCSSVRTTLLPDVWEHIVHLLFTAIGGNHLGGHPTPQVTDLHSRLPFGRIASRVANTHLAFAVDPDRLMMKTIFTPGSRKACNSSGVMVRRNARINRDQWAVRDVSP